MNFKNFLSYDEKLLVSEFTFGFELEAYFHYREKNYVVEEIKKYGLEDACTEYLYDYFETLFSDVDKVTEEGELGEDSSLSHGIDTYAFEWSTPVFKFNPNNIVKVIKKLDQVFSSGLFSIDEKCGFHIHLGLPSSYSNVEKELNLFWFNLNIVADMFKDEEFLDEILMFKGIKLYTDYHASMEYLKQLYRVINIILFKDEYSEERKREEIFNAMEEKYSTRKYNLFSIHSQYGTLEWRGPRGFLDKGTETIREFFLKKLYPMVSRFSTYIDRDEIQFRDFKVTKKEIYNKIVKNKPILRVRGIKRYFVDNIDNKILGEALSKYKSLRTNISYIRNVNIKLINQKFNITEGLLTQISIVDPISFYKDSDNSLQIDNASLDNINITINGDKTYERPFLYNCNVYNTKYIYNSNLYLGNCYNVLISNCDIKNINLKKDVVVDNSQIDTKCIIEEGATIKNSSITNSKILSTNIFGCFIYKNMVLMSDEIYESIKNNNKFI